MIDLIESEGVVASDPKPDLLPKKFQLVHRWELQDELVDTLRQTKHHAGKAGVLLRCHRIFRHWRCSNNHDFAESEHSCSLRICPHCCRRRSLILAGRFEAKLLGKPMNTLRYAVLSERNCIDLVAGIKLLWEAWKRLRRSKTWKKYVKGCIVALEVTRNLKDGTWHPHLNVLMEGEYFPVEQLKQMWVKATEYRSEFAFICAADSGTVRELIKYVTKVSDLVGDPDGLDEFLTAVHKRRLVRSYGSFYPLNLDDEEAPRSHQCPDCESTELVRLRIVPPEQLSMDHRGILRVHRKKRDVDRAVAEAVALRWIPSDDLEEGRKISRELDVFLEPSVATFVANEKWNRYLASDWI